ncbi:CoA ester lyase, partial [Streptomyces sp. SID625]|nr:CoA ester lyase [Streptomyces sp. SID625]
MTVTAAFPLTWLYAPGDRPRVVAKALACGADVVVVDLEDAVAPDRKEYARAATAELLTEPPPVPVHVRVNALDGPLAAADLAAVAARPGLAGLRLPKV